MELSFFDKYRVSRQIWINSGWINENIGIENQLGVIENKFKLQYIEFILDIKSYLVFIIRGGGENGFRMGKIVNLPTLPIGTRGF